jgi:hypothetical protein
VFFPPLIVATSPYLFYYGLNFLPDVPAFSLACIGMYYYFIYLQTNTLHWLVIAAVISILATLLKVTAGIMFVTSALYLLYNYFKPTQNTSKKMVQEGLIYMLSFGTIYAWYHYASTYNKAHVYEGNLLGLLPIWQMTLHEILRVGNRFLYEWKSVIMSNFTWLFFGIAAYFVPRCKAAIPSIYFFIVVTAIGNLAFSLGWLQAFYHHDYYMINLFCVFVFLAIGSMYYLQQYVAKYKYVIYVGLLLLVIKAQFHSSKVQHYRYSAAANVVADSWYTAQPYIRSLGINRHQLVLHLGDGSTNISLYLFNNPGWDECYSPEGNIILHYKNKGAKYVIISDPKHLQNPAYQPYLNQKIGQYQNIHFYKL